MEPGWYSTDRWSGLQVIFATVAWILPHVVPTIRRGHRFVSSCTTVVMCNPRLLAVVVNLNNYAAPPVIQIVYLYLVNNEVNTAVPE